MLDQTSKLFTKKPKAGFVFIYHYWIIINNIIYHYIGSTKNSLKDRSGSNGINYVTERNTEYGCPKFAQLILGYGFTNFNVEILEEVPENDRFIREDYYIELYDAVNTGLNKMRSSTYDRAAALSRYEDTNKVDFYGDVCILHLPDEETCILDKSSYKGIVTTTRYGVDHPGGAGNVDCYDEHNIHRTLAYMIAREVLGEHFNYKARTKITFINKNRRDFRLSNLRYKGKSLAEWVQELKIKL